MKKKKLILVLAKRAREMLNVLTEANKQQGGGGGCGKRWVSRENESIFVRVECREEFHGKL